MPIPDIWAPKPRPASPVRKPEYRFTFAIVDQTTGETVISDWCNLTRIDQRGACESVDIHVGSALRAFERSARAEHEAEHYESLEKVTDALALGEIDADEARRRLKEAGIDPAEIEQHVAEYAAAGGQFGVGA